MDPQKAIFIDRDGVINEMVYNADFGTKDSPLNPGELKMISGVAEAIKLFKKMGFLAIVVSNQPAVAKGKMTINLLEEITEKIKSNLKQEQAALDGVYYCLHHHDAGQVKVKKYLEDCDCRKPKPGLILKAAADLNIDLAHSYMIGDGITDIQAGAKAGCKTIFLGVAKTYQLEVMNKRGAKPDFFAKNLLEAANIVVANQ